MRTIWIIFILLFSAHAFGAIFIPEFDEFEPFIIIEGRASFSQEPYWMIDGLDEFALFLDDVCVGSTNKVNPLVSSHFDEIYMNIGNLDINNLIAKSYSSSTGTIWDAEIMGYNFDIPYNGRDYHIDIRANYDTGQVPEPSSIAFLYFGLLGVIKFR